MGSEPANCVYIKQSELLMSVFSKVSFCFLSESHKGLWSKTGSEPLLTQRWSALMNEAQWEGKRNGVVWFSHWNPILSYSLGYLPILILKCCCLWGPYKGLAILLYMQEHKQEKCIPGKEGKGLWVAKWRRGLGCLSHIHSKPSQQNDPIFSSIWVQNSEELWFTQFLLSKWDNH